MVHPHGSGELPSSSNWKNGGYGSSPRMWGTRHDDRQKYSDNWFIPTGVGNSSIIIIQSNISSGSSPREWGTHTLYIFNPIQYWFIPTGVGNTRPYPTQYRT